MTFVSVNPILQTFNCFVELKIDSEIVGVPQGLCLDPLLILTWISELARVVQYFGMFIPCVLIKRIWP